MTIEEKQQLDNISEDVTELKANVSAVKNALLGNKEFNQPGFIERFQKTEQLVEKHDTLLKSGRYFALGFLLAAGYGIKEIFGHIIDYLKPH